jgi:uncharacterized membrane protein
MELREEKKLYNRKKNEVLPPLGEDDKMLAGLCYPLWPFAGPWALFTHRRKELFVYFHALQGIYLGAATTVISFFSLLFVYLIFFFRNPKNIIDPKVKFDGQVTCGTASVIVLMFLLLALMFVLFYNLWLGWKASQGKIFRLPLIGDIAYTKMDQVRSRLEMEYFNSLSGDSVPEESPEPYQEPSMVSPSLYPATPYDARMPGPDTAQERPDYEAMLRMNPPVEKLKNIFSQVVHSDREEPPRQEPLPIPAYSQKNGLRADPRGAGTPGQRPQVQERDLLKAQRRMEPQAPPRKPQAPPAQEEPKAQPATVLSPEAHMEVLRRKFDEASTGMSQPGEDRPGRVPAESQVSQLDLLRQKYTGIVNKGVPPQGGARNGDAPRRPAAEGTRLIKGRPSPPPETRVMREMPLPPSGPRFGPSRQGKAPGPGSGFLAGPAEEDRDF